MIPGANMQFCLQYELREQERVRQSYDVLKEGASIIRDIGASSPYEKKPLSFQKAAS